MPSGRYTPEVSAAHRERTSANPSVRRVSTEEFSCRTEAAAPPWSPGRKRAEKSRSSAARLIDTQITAAQWKKIKVNVPLPPTPFTPAPPSTLPPLHPSLPCTLAVGGYSEQTKEVHRFPLNSSWGPTSSSSSRRRACFLLPSILGAILTLMWIPSLSLGGHHLTLDKHVYKLRMCLCMCTK